MERTCAAYRGEKGATELVGKSASGLCKMPGAYWVIFGKLREKAENQ